MFNFEKQRVQDKVTKNSLANMLEAVLFCAVFGSMLFINNQMRLFILFYFFFIKIVKINKKNFLIFFFFFLLFFVEIFLYLLFLLNFKGLKKKKKNDFGST